MQEIQKYSLYEGGLGCSMGGAQTLRCHTAGDERHVFYSSADDDHYICRQIRPLSVPFLLCTSGKGTDTATMLKTGKIWEIQFFTTNMGHHRPKCTQIDESTCQAFRRACKNKNPFTIQAAASIFPEVILQIAPKWSKSC